jgi:UDP-N-acetylglucosamine acyltransferase
MSEGVHPQAEVCQGAELGKNVSIGPFTVIESGVKIGDNVRIGPQCHIRAGTTLEDHCNIESGAKIGIMPKRVQVGENTGVRIGQYVTIGENVTIERSSKDGKYTTIGQNSWVLPCVHVGHNAEIGKHVFITNNTLLAGYVRIDDFANIGAGVGVHQFCSIGERAFVGGFAKVAKDILPYAWMPNEREIYGLNKIGLTRTGMTPEERMTPEEVQNAKAAYAALIAVKANTDKRIAALKALGTKEADKIVAFIERADRGIYLPRSSKLINPIAHYRNKDAYHGNNKH